MLRAELSDSRDGALIRRLLTRPTTGGLGLGLAGACVLPVPAERDAYSAGRTKQTLRRKVRSAQRQGVTCRRVDDPVERGRLAVALEHCLAHKSDERYRWIDGDCSALVPSRVWLVAEDPAGDVLLVAVSPVDGHWAVLQCFVTLGTGPQHSDARYLLTQALVEELSDHGVRYLVDTRAPIELTPGLRHFQRMLGFGIRRVLVRARARAWTP